MRSLADDDEVEVKPSGPAKTMTAEQPAWMRALLERSKEWLNAVPEVSSTIVTIRFNSMFPFRNST